MAQSGKRPKSPALRLVTGTHRTTKHGDAEKVQKAVEEAEASFGPLEKPKGMRGQAAWCWDKLIAPCFWLDGSSLSAAIMYCQLWAEFKSLGSGFPAAKYAQFRAIGSELGIHDHRNRGERKDGKPKQTDPHENEFE